MDNKDIKYDNCVCCGKQTNEPEARNVDHRNYYVDGAGQLCEDCYIEVYGNFTING